LRRRKSRKSWKRVKEECCQYQRRVPERSGLYRLVYHSREELERQWSEQLQPEYGALRHEVFNLKGAVEPTTEADLPDLIVFF